ncbi:MAG: hypothetical protein ACTSRS_09820 [Candidatus Helarchaeota archaeon]
MKNDLQSMLDKVVEIAVHAVNNMERTQMNGLLEKLESEEGEKGVAILILHIMRQNARGKIQNPTAKLLIAYLKDLLSKESAQSKENAREFLGMLKWLYEANTELRVKPQDLKSPYFNSYLEAFIHHK